MTPVRGACGASCEKTWRLGEALGLVGVRGHQSTHGGAEAERMLDRVKALEHG
jgi:hypothetical protein